MEEQAGSLLAGYILDELARWRDEAFARGDRELASRLQKVSKRLRGRIKLNARVKA
ncbi:MAG TPA: hypothetical protein VHR47_04770 [Bacillota bacterium]|nr:hypothetical protein [Bacillota bacterium]